MLCIIINSLLLVFFNYEDRDSNTYWNKALNFIGDVFTVIFFVEAALKIAAAGFILHRYAYLRDPWNIADFAIVVTG